jgi:hypothetical protein
MTNTVIDTVAPRTFQNGTTVRPARTIPANFAAVAFQLNCTTGNPASPFAGFANPFNDPAMAITFGMRWSWDGGATFAMSTEGIQHGNPTGVWATDKHGNPVMTPDVRLGLPSINNQPPNTYRAYATLSGGPVSTGLTVTETTVP